MSEYNVFGTESMMDHAVASDDGSDSTLDEILGMAHSAHSVGVEAAAEATRKVIAQAQAERLSPPPMRIVAVEDKLEDEPCVVEEVLGYNWQEVLGDAEIVGAGSDPAAAISNALWMAASYTAGRAIGDALPVSSSSDGSKPWWKFWGPDEPTKTITPAPTNYQSNRSDQILGDETSVTATTNAPVATGDLPLLRRMHGYFKSKMPKEKTVRIDTPESYADFVTKKQFGILDSHLRELRSSYEDHMSRLHGGDFKPLAVWDTVLGEDGEHDTENCEVPLSLPPFAEGKVKCWRSGDNVCTSIAIPGTDGTPRVLTATAPIMDHAEEVAGYVERCGVDPIEVMGVLPHLACMLGGGAMIPQLAKATPEILGDAASMSDRPVLRKMVPAGDPGNAALMALCQQAQHGDEAAKAEWIAIAKIAKKTNNEKLGQAMLDAANRLQVAQAVKSA